MFDSKRPLMLSAGHHHLGTWVSLGMKPFGSDVVSQQRHSPNTILCGRNMQ